jgi:hypothetical protein
MIQVGASGCEFDSRLRLAFGLPQSLRMLRRRVEAVRCFERLEAAVFRGLGRLLWERGQLLGAGRNDGLPLTFVQARALRPTPCLLASFRETPGPT